MTKAKATEETTPKGEIVSGKVVKYIGTSDVRIIDQAAWKNVDVEDQGKVVWSEKNKWRVDAADLSDGALAYCDEAADFAIVDAVS